ncbi:MULTISPECIES: hypothetical protein [Streptomyces]|uniref:hypothetical protein n=1 Tax=Streptomyces TaxID=1883 RepID=UPI001E5C635A|nr:MULTISPECIES: hypothetical protein [Streptomyces]UFQ19966.1 hypothetical protein J2N69_36205 [Streptomyces huasconensis]WCL89587.1 hypothetical protein PPN52_36145 [Streptomyces sp. JCM 35825]
MYDAGWLGEARYAIGCTTLLLGTSLLVDAAAHGLTLLRTTAWSTLAAALLVILLPVRVSAGPGRLTVQGLWATKTVRTDRLTAVDWPADIGQQLVLTDRDGVRTEVDLRVLIANPALWLRLETDARAAEKRGTLGRGAASLDRVSLRIDAETARSVFNMSGLR